MELPKYEDLKEEQRERLDKFLRKLWNDAGECRSCGWHSAFYEIEDVLYPDGADKYIFDESNYETKGDASFYRVGCRNEGDDDHRGARLYGIKEFLKELAKEALKEHDLS